MPIYEYVCRNCGEELEKLQGMSDAPLTECSACGESALKRKVSAPGFRLAGSGWYETDFKENGRRYIAGEQHKETESDGKSNGDKSSSDSGGDSNKDSGSKSKPEGRASGSGNKDTGKSESATAD